MTILKKKVWQLLKKLNTCLLYGPAGPILLVPQVLTQEKKKRMHSYRHLHTTVHSSFIYNIPRLKNIPNVKKTGKFFGPSFTSCLFSPPQYSQCLVLCRHIINTKSEFVRWIKTPERTKKTIIKKQLRVALL